MTTTTMNLTTDPWIPAANAAGETTHLSLRQVFAEGQHWQDFAVRPHERVALMRLLICIAQAALKGPMSSLDGVLEALPAKAEAYLIEWRESFGLFDPQRPFLQFAGLMKPPKPPKPAKKAAKAKAGPSVSDGEVDEVVELKQTLASKLDFALASGDNTTLFDHDGNRESQRKLSSSQLAIALITFQCFSPSGTIGSAHWRGQVTPGTFPGKALGSSSNAPCLPSSMLHAFVRKSDILSTLVVQISRDAG
jgi:CRISPR system Cascade subunit CasA